MRVAANYFYNELLDKSQLAGFMQYVKSQTMVTNHKGSVYTRYPAKLT